MVEGEVTLGLSRTLWRQQRCHISLHVDTQLTIQILLALIEGSDPYSHLDTHVLKSYIFLDQSLHIIRTVLEDT